MVSKRLKPVSSNLALCKNLRSNSVKTGMISTQPEERFGPSVSVVTPVRNEAESLPALIDALLNQTFPPAEVIVVDGGSTDRTVEVVRGYAARDERVRLVEQGEAASPGRNRNTGVAAARYDWIAFIDAGIRPELTWLAELVRAVADAPATEVVYGNFEPVTDTFFERCAALAYPPPKQDRPGGQMRGPFIASSLVRRNVCRAVGGFPDLRAAEDLIFMERIERAGYRIAWSPRAIVWWHLRPTLVSTFRRFVLYSKHNVWIKRQHGWHYGLARQYALVLPFVGLSFAHRAWWLLVPALWLLARTAKNIWRRREGRRLWWALNPFQFFGVLIVMLTVDAGTFVGWAQALLTRPATPTTDTSTGNEELTNQIKP